MLEWMFIRAITVACFILANAFFVAAEFALISVRETCIQQLIDLGRPGARTALQLKHAIDEFLPAVQFGVTLASLALGWIGEPAIAEIILRLASTSLPALPPHAVIYAHTIAIVLAFAFITYFEVLLGELVYHRSRYGNRAYAPYCVRRHGSNRARFLLRPAAIT